jgi:hypothetical protein
MAIRNPLGILPPANEEADVGDVGSDISRCAAGSF